MPNKRNGMYRRKPKLDLHGLYSKDDQSFGFGNKEMTMASVLPRQHGEVETQNVVHFLFDVFPKIDVEIIQDVVREYNGNLEECTRKLQEIYDVGSLKQNDTKINTDLAIIACSLLADESQPVGSSKLDIYDSPDDFSNDLGCSSQSDIYHLDYEIPGHDFSLIPDVHQSSTYDYSRKPTAVSSDYRSNTSSNMYVQSMNGDVIWSEQNVIQHLENDESYTGYVNKNNETLIMQTPDELNISLESSDPLKGKDDSKQKSNILNYLYQFGNLPIPDNIIDLSPDNVKSAVFNGEIYFAHNNQISGKFSSNDNTKGENDSFMNYEHTKPEASSDLLNCLNKLNGLSINPLPKTSSREWDKFYSSFESEVSVYSDSYESIKHVDELEQHTAGKPSISRKNGYQSNISITSSDENVSNDREKNMSAIRTQYPHTNGAMKPNPHVDNNNAFQRTEEDSVLEAAIKPVCSLETVPSIGNSSSSISLFNEDESEGDKKNSSTIQQLSPAALEFIPRPLAKHHSKQLAWSNTTQVTSALRSNNSRNTKTESISLISNSDSNQLNEIQPLRSGNFTSSSKTSVPNKILTNVESQKVINPIDPLGWNDVFSVNTTPLKDSKPQRVHKVRKTPKNKSSQLAAPLAAFCPWQTFDVSESPTLNPSRVSSLKGKPEELSEGRFKTFLNSSANTVSSLHEVTNHESMISDYGSGNKKGEDSRTLKVTDSPIGVRLPPSLISKAAPAAVQTEVNLDSSKVINIPSSDMSKKNVVLTLETRTQNLPSDSAQSRLIKNRLQLRGVKTPVGIIRRYILEKQPVMVVLRGLPGSGKSYLAKQLIAESQQMGVQGVILSTDDYFLISGQYCFNPYLLPEAHDWNKTRALHGMKESRSPIIIDNTNTALWELLPYAVQALEHSYDVQIFEPDTSWRMKVAELARKNSHGVGKENIRRMKDRWENFSLDDVLKQASHSIATRKSHAVVPENVTTVTPSSTRQQKQPMDIQMNNNEHVPVTEATPQINTNVNTTSHDLGLADWFDTQAQLSQTKMKKHERPAKPSERSPLRGITKDFLNQSLKKAIVNIIMTPPSPASDPPTSLHQTESLSERLVNNSVVGEEIVIRESNLSSDESWNSESETPTADKSLQFTEQISVGDVEYMIQNEKVTVETSDISSDLLLRLKLTEVFDESSVLSNSFSTSGSYHTLASNSDASSYHTLDNDDADYEEMIPTDLLASDGFEDVDLIMEHVHLGIYEPQNGVLNNPSEMDAELMPVYFDGITLPSVKDERVHHSTGTSSYLQNQGLGYNSTDLTVQNNHKEPTEGAGMKQTLSFPTKPLSVLRQSSSPVVASFLGDLDSEKDSLGSGLFAHKLVNGCDLQNKPLRLSLVDYSGSDDSDTEPLLPNDEQLVSLKAQKDLYLNGPSADTKNVLYNLNGGQVDAPNCSQNVQESPRTYIREISIDRSTQSSEDSVMSGREQSPQVDSQLISCDVQHKKKKKRVRKGRSSEPFIEDSLKAKSKTQNWSSFVVPSSGSSNSSGDSVVLENPIMDTSSSSTQTDPYIFSIVHKLNSPAFNSLQPLEWNLSGIEIITSSSQSTVPERWSSTTRGNDTVIFRKVGSTVDHSTITDETLEKEEVNLETLQSCFPEFTRKQLEATLAICHNDLEWVTSHLLDSPALYDMEEEEDDDEEAMRANSIKSENDSVSLGSSKNAVKSLADICTTLVRNTNKVDADDLEMQMIHVGEDRLQKIEMFGRSRLHSLSEDLGNQNYFPDDFVLDDFPLPWAAQERQPNLIQNQAPLFRTSHFDGESISRKSDLPTTLIKKKEFPSFTIKSSSSQGKEMQGHSSMSDGNVPLSSSPPIELHETVAVSTATGEVSHSVAGQSQLIMPLDFIQHLESLYGQLDLQMENEGLALDDGTARKIYNCLKLKAAKKVVKNSNEQQLKKDEALARALQEEENSSTSSTTSNMSGGKGQASNRHSVVPGWTDERPSWMAEEKDNANNLNISVNMSGETVRPHSVADTLHQLRGTERSRVRAHKFQKKMPGSVKSVWYSARRRGQADSLASIMEEEMAREEQQREQLRIIESTGDMEALATRIKRIELSNLFPSMGPDILEDIFRSTGFSKEETIRVLQESYNIPPAPMSKDKEDILNQLRKSQQDFNHVEDLYEDEISNEDSGMTYDSLRNEAVFCHQLAADCQQQALRYQSTGMQGAALFYRQRAKKYKENERAANFKAAQFLFEKGSERLQVENTLDLHFYRLDEAINAVNVAIDIKEDEYRKKPDKKNSYLDIVTGWGRNSKNGKPKLKPAIINHLWTRCFQYEERSPGMLRVYIGKRLVA